MSSPPSPARCGGFGSACWRATASPSRCPPTTSRGAASRSATSERTSAGQPGPVRRCGVARAPGPDSPDQSAAAGWLARLAAYKEPDLKRSVWQLASAAALYAGAWALMYASLGVGYWLTLLLAVPAAFLLVRLFIIQHDCGHGAFFRSPRAADIVGSI